jgi:hypothetical protein
MNKRGTALSFFAIAALLFIGRQFTHHVTAAIVGANNGNMSSGQYPMALDLTSTYSVVPEIIALFAGIVFLIWSFVSKEK